MSQPHSLFSWQFSSLLLLVGNCRLPPALLFFTVMERFHMYNLSAIMVDLFNDLLAVSSCRRRVQSPMT